MSPSGRLATNAMRQITGAAALAEPTERRFGTVRLHLAELMQARGLAFPMSEVARKLTEHWSRRRFG